MYKGKRIDWATRGLRQEKAWRCSRTFSFFSVDSHFNSSAQTMQMERWSVHPLVSPCINPFHITNNAIILHSDPQLVSIHILRPHLQMIQHRMSPRLGHCLVYYLH